MREPIPLADQSAVRRNFCSLWVPINILARWSMAICWRRIRLNEQRRTMAAWSPLNVQQLNINGSGRQSRRSEEIKLFSRLVVTLMATVSNYRRS